MSKPANRAARRASVAPYVLATVGGALLLQTSPVCMPQSLIDSGASQTATQTGTQIVNQTGRELTAEELAAIEQNTANANIVVVLFVPGRDETVVDGATTGPTIDPTTQPVADPNSPDFVSRHSLVGEVRMWSGSWDQVPPGWMLCDGRTLDPADYPKLFKVIGTRYSTDSAVPTFSLPDFRNRTPMGADGSNSLLQATTTVEGSPTPFGGSVLHFLSGSELPSHAHDISHSHSIAMVSGSPGFTDVSSASVGSPATGSTDPFVGQSGFTGTGLPFSVLDPYFAVNYIIFTGLPAPQTPIQ